MSVNEGEASASDEAREPKSATRKPTKVLPTDRVSYANHKVILRGAAKASLAVEKGGVSNNDIGQYAGISPSSISNCNAFLIDSGLLVRDGIKLRPVEAVFEYDTAAEWNADEAVAKLAPVLANTWYGKAMLTKLAIKPSTMAEAIAFLGQLASAGPEFRGPLEMLLTLLSEAGLIVIDGNNISKASVQAGAAQLAHQPAGQTPDGKTNHKPPNGETKRFSVPVPDKADALVELPVNMDEDDWKMVQSFINTYVKRAWKFPDNKNSAASHDPKGSEPTEDSR